MIHLCVHSYWVILQIRSIKDDVEYYIEASHEEDFMHNDDLYDDIIGLAELELGVASNNSAEANGNNILFSRSIKLSGIYNRYSPPQNLKFKLINKL